MEEKHETEKKRTKPFKQFLSFSKDYKLYQKPLTEGKQCKESFFANLQYNDAGDEPIERPKPVQTLSDDVKQQVEIFYRCDDISREAPGRKDVVSVKENGSRAKY